MRHVVTSVVIPVAAVLALGTGCGAELTPDAANPGQIIGKNDLEVIEEAKGTPLYDYARAVAKVALGGGSCTGFRVAADLFITNHHCWSGSSCARTTFTLGYERDLPASERAVFTCREVLAKSSGLDYALYRVTPPANGRGASFPVFALSQKALARNMPLFIAGYPYGYEFKRMDRSDDCKLTTLPGGSYPNYVSYTCDTDSGSSGSSVIDRETGHVVALHWGHMGGNDNKGTAIAPILEHIRQTAPAAYRELTLAE